MTPGAQATPQPAQSPPTPRRPRGWTVHVEKGRDEVGTVLGDRFELTERLGHGGMAVVYAARDRALRSRAAIKILRSREPDMVRRFRDEIEILSNLQHPHLVNVRAAGETPDGAMYLALEYLPGETLERRLERGPLLWREAVEIGVQVASALDALHRAGVIHRDVKPPNIILLAGTAGRIVVKLIDLGIAKMDDDIWQRASGASFTPLPRRPTDTGKAIGTPGFLPLEAGLARPDPRFDVYALGVTLYLTCTGRMPGAVGLLPMGDTVPADLSEVVAAALALEPDERIASAGELKRRLEAVQAAHSGSDRSAYFDGSYELLGVLGVGGKAEVYRAYHLGAARYTAIKLLSGAALKSDEERARFEREARSLAAVDHPAIPRLFDYRGGERPYLAMELAAGTTAGRFCTTATRLAQAEVIEIGLQLAGALGALNARGILHRDINANNVLIDFRRKPIVKLIDLGMCELTPRFYAGDLRYPTPPDARGRLGNGGLERLQWTAPEARAGAGWTDKSDVYSLGLLLYRLLTGLRPTRGDPQVLISPCDVVTCSGELASALLAALHHDPEERLDVPQLIERLTDAAEAEREESEFVADEAAPAASVPPVVEPPAPVIVESPVRPARLWKYAMAVLALIGIAGVGYALGGDEGHAPAVASVPERRAEPAAPAVESTPATRATPTPEPVVLSMEQALRAAGPVLQRCAKQEGREMSIEFRTAKDSPRFAAFDLLTPASKDGHACVEAALADITFAPTAPRIFIEEFAP